MIIEEIDSKLFQNFLRTRISEVNDFTMNIKSSEFFENFNLYPEKIVKVIIVENHVDKKILQEKGYFKNPNDNLFIVLNNTYSVNKKTNKVKDHFEYWRKSRSNMLDKIYTEIDKEKKFKYLFIGSDLAYDFSTLIGEDSEKVLLPDTNSNCWDSEELKRFD